MLAAAFLGATMRHSWPAALLVRAVFVFLTACCLTCGGILLDRLAGTSPVGVLSSLVVAITFGVIMIYVIITSSFPGEGGK